MCESKIQLIKENVLIENVLKFYDNSIDINNKNMCRCIIHKDTNPSLKINYDTNTFWCFGCGKHGDVIDLVQYGKD
jgi:DNA primase